MKTFKMMNPKFVYPYESSQVEFWTKKWGIDANELNEAILQTGSVRSREIKKHLERKGVLFSISSFKGKLLDKWSQLTLLFKEEEHYL